MREQVAFASALGLPLERLHLGEIAQEKCLPHRMCCYRLTTSMPEKSTYSPCLFLAALSKRAAGLEWTKLEKIMSSSLHTALFSCPRQWEMPAGRKRHSQFVCTEFGSRALTQTLHIYAGLCAHQCTAVEGWPIQDIKGASCSRLPRALQ